jgi:hypothetical protein
VTISRAVQIDHGKYEEGNGSDLANLVRQIA